MHTCISEVRWEKRHMGEVQKVLLQAPCCIFSWQHCEDSVPLGQKVIALGPLERTEHLHAHVEG